MTRAILIRKASSLFLIWIALWIGACTPSGTDPGQRLSVVATTTIIGDVVGRVAGEGIELSVLLPVGVDPHSFEPVPGDVEKIAGADLVFLNGLGLETFMDRLVENAGGNAQIVVLSEGIEPIALQAGDHDGEQDHLGAEYDPHVWMDPNNVIIWADHIASSLSQHDPAQAALYQANASAYADELRVLDAWASDQIAAIPQSGRQLVSDHDSLAYFARRYQFEIVGAVIPSYSTLAAPSAQEYARLVEQVRSRGVAAIFVDASINPVLAERLAADSGAALVPLYTASLTGPAGPAASYLDFMRYNIGAIVQALQ